MTEEKPEITENEQPTSSKELPSRERSFFWLSILFDCLLFIVTSVYALFAYNQWQVMKTQADIMSKQAEVMSKQLETTQHSLDQTQEMLGYAETQAKASSEQAKASVVQAEAAKQSVSAAQASARFAEESVRVGQQSMVAANQAHVSITKTQLEDEFGLGRTLILTATNDGNSPASNINGEVSLAIVPTIPESPFDLHYRNATFHYLYITPHGERTGRIVISPEQFNPDQIQEVIERKQYFLVFGWLGYISLGKRTKVLFCSKYNPERMEFSDCWNRATSTP